MGKIKRNLANATLSRSRWVTSSLSALVLVIVGVLWAAAPSQAATGAFVNDEALAKMAVPGTVFVGETKTFDGLPSWGFQMTTNGTVSGDITIARVEFPYDNVPFQTERLVGGVDDRNIVGGSVGITRGPRNMVAIYVANPLVGHAYAVYLTVGPIRYTLARAVYSGDLSVQRQNTIP